MVLTQNLGVMTEFDKFENILVIVTSFHNDDLKLWLGELKHAGRMGLLSESRDHLVYHLKP